MVRRGGCKGMRERDRSWIDHCEVTSMRWWDKSEEVERLEGLVETRCERFKVRVRGRDVMVGEVVETGIQDPNCPLPSSSISD